MPMPYYPYFSQNAPQMPQMPPMPQIQQQNNTRSDFVVVRSEEEARNYPVAFGNTVTFKHESEPYMYTKTMGVSQLDRPVFERYKLITVLGEPRLTSRAIYTPQAVSEFGNVTSTAIIKVPRGCCFSVSVDSVPATADPTITPAPIIEVQNANLVINRIA